MSLSKLGAVNLETVGSNTAGLGGLWYWRSNRRGSDPSGIKPVPGKPSSSVTARNGLDSAEGDAGDPEGLSKPTYIVLKNAGNDFFRAEKYQDALQKYTQAIEEETPKNAEDLAMLYQNRAAVFEKLGDFSSTIKECSQALDLNPKYIKALSRRSKAYKQTGFLDEALEDITAICILEQFQHPSSVQLADDILKELGQQEASKLAESRRLVAPSAHAVNAFLRSFYNDPITILWNQTKEGSGDSTEVEVTKGYAAAVHKLQKRDYDSIIDLCSEEINNPNSAHLLDAYHLRGTFRFLWGSRDGTVEDLTRVIDSATNNLEKASALVKLGSFHALQDNDQDYMKCFERAEELTPDNVDVFHHRGQVLLTKGVVDEAVNQLERATKMCPDFALAAASHLYILYRLHVHNENSTGRDEVFKSFPKLLRKFPNSPDVFNLYGQVLMENQQFHEADQQFDKVLELDPTNASVYVHKAMAQFQINRDPDKMIQTLRDSLKMDDRNEFVYETLGTLELQSGNLDKAVEAIGKALEYAKSFQEMMMLSSLKKAAEVQVKIKNKIGLQTPVFPPMPNGTPVA
ncbi:unnamed protein product [Allacma fusca]|uniref:Mitochondrial import receptor subunit TOM70 n=1 Tax=Allacma fusca TaxID=39272 RepID=A0A8J2P494_9HEXA|nr:unnamed protein product [Allacma fusca]